MKILVNIASDGFDGFLTRVKAAEDAGLYGVGVGDTPHFRDPYVSLAAAAAATSRIRLGTAVTNAVTRHPAALAAGVSALDDLSGGRAFLGIGAGDSAAHHRGLRPSKLAELRESIAAVRDLFAGGTARFGGKDVGAQFTTGQVPVVLAAGGPGSLRLAGEIADTVLIGGGIDQVNVSTAIGAVRDGEAAAGRRPGSVGIWIVARTAIAPSLEEGYESVKVVLSVAGNHALRADLASGRVPAELAEPARAYCERYSFAHHGTAGDNPNVALYESLGLREYLLERLAVIGTGEQVAAAYGRLMDIGVEGVLVPAVAEDSLQLIQRLGDEVVPRVGTGSESLVD
ncbi:LLM class flavin-dependent oxidoreductase [Arthrobacter sp. I2-34]|uniref:LLM class flavin-dependent oxidoreductase n=1 Tax=Arthrobacter hankyongi TaxID=2904801 RepID=A0ABS9LA00_9MICC|nr:LLM class flavin-dependent oxidoreductase [Arthrobacter hankyongi]MCG2623421.1 LLM class flavin-dependent oxidoreductase [Arthrobacter hankyongi]